MPIIRTSTKLIYFSHIPKCGGASVEAYLHAVSGGKLAFLDNNYRMVNESVRWCKSPPQHIDGAALSKLFPAAFFDAFFAVTRNPVARFESAFHFQKYVESTIGLEISINDFIKSLDYQKITHSGYYDNHFMPQYMFLYPDIPYTFFKLEEGLENVKAYIDTLFFGNERSQRMPHVNAKRSVKSTPHEPLSPLSEEKLRTLYSHDYELFGY